MTNKFKVGDRVRVISEGKTDSDNNFKSNGLKIGDEFIIKEIVLNMVSIIIKIIEINNV